MKQILKKCLAVFAAIVIVSAVFTGCASSKNQTSKSASGVINDTPLKLDPSIKIGELDNGMTYYIKKNGEPQNRIYLRLAVKAGSKMEKETERGVAHFIEHLAFNGTENFDKSAIVDWFEKIGMNFGSGVNAYTSFEETVYKLEIPADDPDLLKNAMLVLHDWASGITFPQEEIDKERGVIQEEWRLTSLGLNGRTTNAVIPFLMKDSVFEDRLPIGNMDVIKNVTRDEIVNFYKNWYHPEIMSVAVVGDADVSKIEKVIKEVMGTIPASENKIETSYDRVPRETEKQILVFTDPEQQYPIFQVMEQQPYVPFLKTENDLLENMKLTLATYIFNIRASAITNSADATWLGANIGATYYNNADMFSYLAAIPKEGMFLESMKALFAEYDRAMAYGITDAELQMVKNAVISELNNYLANKDKINSDNIVSSLVSYYLTGAVLQSPEEENKVLMKLVNSITVDDINDTIRNSFADRGSKMLVLAPEGYSDLPSEKEIMAVWKDYKTEGLEAYTDDSITKLMDKPATKGKAKVTGKNKELGTTEYVLSNGIKIITKKTDFEKDTIVMEASSKGGNYYVSDEDYPSYRPALEYAFYSGFNGYTYSQITKFLADKKISYQPGIHSTSETLTGTSTNADLEYLLQYVNLTFSACQYTEDAWKMLMDNYIVLAKNHGATPGEVFQDKINEVMFGKDDLRHAPFDMTAFEKIDPENAQKIVEERFKNPADFTFVFLGDFNEKKLIELCEYYLGTLETTDDREETKYIYWDFPKEIITETVKKGIDEQGRVFMAFGGELPPQKDMETGFKESTIVSELVSLLNIRLREVVREDNGGSYGVGVEGGIDGYPERFYWVEVGFGCEPKREEELSAAVLDTIKQIQKDGVSDDNIQKLREAYRREHETNLRNNWWWLNRINAVSIFTYQPSWIISDTDTVCSWITSENLQEAAKKYLNTDVYAAVYLKPEK